MSASVREVRVRHPKVLYLVQLTWVKVEKGNNKQGRPSFCAGVTALRYYWS